MKKIVYIVATIILLGFSLNSITIKNVCYAEESSTENNLSTQIENGVDSIDLSGLENYYNELKISNELTIKEYIVSIINGETKISIESIFDLLLYNLKTNITSYISFFLLLIVIGLLMCFAVQFRLRDEKNSIVNIIELIFFTVIITLVVTIFWDSISSTINAINNVCKIVEIIFPIMTTLLISVGAPSTSLALEPIFTFFIGFVIAFLLKFLIPLVIVTLAFKIVSQLSENLKFDKLCDFFNSIFKWSIGIIFTIFLGITSIKSMFGGASDKISIKTAKYAIKNYVPIVGGYLSESYDIFKAGSVLIKNSLGVVTVVIVLLSVVGTLASLLILQLGIKLCSSIIEPMGANKLSKFLNSLSNTFVQLLAILISLFMMIFVLILVIISAGNTI